MANYEDEEENNYYDDPDRPLSPFEQALGGQYTEGMDVPQSAIDVYESSGAAYPGSSPIGEDSKFDPSPSSGAPDLNDSPDPVSGPVGSSESPREMASPTSKPRQPSGSSSGGGDSNNTPARPRAPSPVSAQPPAPFEPMPQLNSLAGSATLRPYVSQSQQYDQDSQPGGLFGQAGGRLGGGLGVPGAGDEFSDTSENPLDMLIQMILQGGMGG